MSIYDNYTNRQQQLNNTKPNLDDLSAGTDPYGRNGAGTTGTSASFRQRGEVSQKRVNTDTRVRDDANSGTAGANGKVGSMAAALSPEDAAQAQQAPDMPVNASWQATRQSVKLNDVRSRVLQSLLPQQG